MNNELVTQGIEALKAGDKVKARHLFISAIKQKPNDEEAWKGLYSAVENNEQRIRCLQEILRINPANENARQTLEKLQAPVDALNELFQKAEQPPQVPPQPNIQTAACSSCGAPLKIPPDTEHINCSYCGASLTVQRSAGSIALKLAEKVSQAIQESETETQAVIQQGTSVTRDELKQIQLRQDLSTAQLQYSTTRAEIRALEREKRTMKITRQLRELHATEAELSQRIKILEQTINPAKKAVVSTKPKRTGCGCSALISPFMKLNTKTKIIVISAWVVLCIACIVIATVSSPTPSAKATKTAEAMKTDKLLPSVTFSPIHKPDTPTLSSIQETPTLFSTQTPLPLAKPTLSPAAPLVIQPTSTIESAGTGPCICSQDYNCKDFSTQSQAQSCFDSCGGSATNNWSGLDGNDHDGKVCETLP